MFNKKNNTGNRNTGNCNTGNCNTGYWNTGNWNTGSWNTGNHNTGNRNTGSWNTGNCNTGNHNTGGCNTGYWNTGNHNTGNWNTGSWNTGYCNTEEPKFRIFNKEAELSREEIVFPDFFYFRLAEWIFESEMTDKEKDAYPSYVTCGGYLKCYEYKQAWRESWDNADDKDRRKVMDLPNWDNEIFKEISGIDVEKELNKSENKSEKMIEIDGKKWSKSTIKEALKNHIG